MKIYFPTMENLFSCDGNFSFMQWYQNNVPQKTWTEVKSFLRRPIHLDKET